MTVDALVRSDAYARGVARAADERARFIDTARTRLTDMEATPEAERFHYSTKADGKQYITSIYPEMELIRWQIERYDESETE